MSNNIDSPPRKTGTSTLVIDNFSKLDSFKYVDLKIEELSLQFGFAPKTSVHYHYEYYSFVCLVSNSNQKTFNFHVKASILAKCVKVYTKEYDGAFDEQNIIVSFSLLPQSRIVPENGYLFYDKLTLFCEIEIIDQTPNNTLALQQDLSNLSEDFQTLLNDGKFRDATLVVGKDGKELHVHKNILAVRSPVFAAMFEHDCEEKRLNKVTITDIDSNVCLEMLRYIYTGQVQSLDQYAMDLLEVADKYQLDSLKNICGNYLSATLSIESAANVLILADLHHATNLKTKCIEYISQNIDQVETTDGWKPLETNAKLLRELFFLFSQKEII